MTEREFYKRVCEMTQNHYMAGAPDPEVVIIPSATVIDAPEGMMEVGMRGGIEVLHVETPYGRIQVVKDPYCPKDKWYLVDWLTVERWYEQVREENPLLSMARTEKKVLEKLDGK